MGATSEVALLSRALKAPRIAALASSLAEQVRSEGWDYEHYLVQVLHEEVGIPREPRRRRSGQGGPVPAGEDPG